MTDELTAREALARLPSHLRLARGGVRIHARFHDGIVYQPVRISAFRIPPHALEHGIERGTIGVQLLEHVARRLGLDDGDTELTVEYDVVDGEAHLRWLDLTWLD